MSSRAGGASGGTSGTIRAATAAAPGQSTSDWMARFSTSTVDAITTVPPTTSPDPCATNRRLPASGLPVRWHQMSVLDMCDPYRSFATRFFPNARLVADKLHVLRLLSPAINRHRRLVERRSAFCCASSTAPAEPVSRGVRRPPGARPVGGEAPRTASALRRQGGALHMVYRTRGYDRRHRPDAPH